MNQKCKVILKGSIYNNTAHEFSDIDLVLKRMDKKTIEEFIYKYGDVALISRTQRPLGIIIVIYSNGLCLDLDFREKFTQDEIDDSDVIGSEFEEEDIAGNIIRCENILESDKEDDWESMQRLFHRSLIKWLGGKEELGYSILLEIIDFIKNKKGIRLKVNGNYKDDFLQVLERYNHYYMLSLKYYRVIENLLEKELV